jgi:type I restriction enzyme R subunit
MNEAETRAEHIATTLDEYVLAPDDQVVEGDVEAGHRYTESDFNKRIEIKEREAFRVKYLLERIDQKKRRGSFAPRRNTRSSSAI